MIKDKQDLIEKLDKLILMLCKDNDVAEDFYDLEKLTENDKLTIFRGLSNMRQPKPLTKEFVKLQDEVLTYLKGKKFLIETDKLTYKDNMTIFQGDITTLVVDAIVNAGNSRMLGSFAPCDNSIDNVIMSAGGLQIRDELSKMMKKQAHPEPVGKVKCTNGYNLPCKYIFHTVGPMILGKVSNSEQIDLANCYKSCLNLAKEMKIKSIAFCCISTGVFKFPRELASNIATRTVKQWLAKNNYDIKVVFCVYNDFDRRLYEENLKY